LAELVALLAWMRSQPFPALRESGLLESVEVLVVSLHRAVFGEPWAPPQAYRWIRYEDPEPVDRLAEAVDRLRAEAASRGIDLAPWAAGNRSALEAALESARGLGFG